MEQSTSKTDVYERYQLHTTNDRFYIEPCEMNGGVMASEPCLQVDRTSSDLSLGTSHNIPVQADRRTIYGIIGVVRLVAGPYLLVITKTQLIGSINSHKIYKVQEAEALPYAKTTLHLTEREIWYNRHFLEMVQTVINGDGYYYSPTFDLTHSLQRLDNTTPEFRKMSMHERADERFLWNRHVLKELTQERGVKEDPSRKRSKKEQLQLERFAMPLLHGFVGMRHVSVAGRTLQLTVFSRRSWQRAGTRLFMRGANDQGHTANFVESEQIIEYNASSNVGDKYLCSFVQTRGSIPLFWSQKPNLKWLPFPQLQKEGDEQQAAFDRHMQDQLLCYNSVDQVIVNLVSKKGRELQICREFERVATETKLKQVRYYAFDFHRECRNMNWDRLSVLNEDLRPAVQKFKFFGSRIDYNLEEPCVQVGYFRTNCMDCLDRTNVVQSLIAKESLKEQLKWLGILSNQDDLSNYPTFEHEFKMVWADNGDFCSSQYAGTGALKADFTRFGKRTYTGLFHDGRNAITRYFKNNFWDGYRQDAVDLFLGNFVVDKNHLPPAMTTGMTNTFDWHTGIALGAAVSLAMAILCLLVASEHMVQFFLFWMSVFIVLSAVIVANGHEFVNSPKLKQD